MFVAYPPYLREKARQLRQDKHLTLDELAECLALPKTTVYYWIRDIPLGKARRNSGHKGNRRMQDMYRRRREAAYRQGELEFLTLERDPSFREFVALYIAEGYKRNRNRVSIANSDLAVMQVSVWWLRRLSVKQPRFAIQYHVDQNIQELQTFWGEHLGTDPHDIRLQRKSNSNGLAGRKWRSVHGVITATISDTALRARMQAFMDLTRQRWLTLDHNGV
jgi:hypothetical protein